MADYNSGLPVRTEADGTDERVHVKVVDGATPSRRMTVDTDLNAHVEIHGNDPGGVDRVERMSESGNPAHDGFYDASNNSVPSSAAPIVVSRVAAPAKADQVIRQTGIIAASGNVRSADVSIFDESGIPFSASNPLPVTSVDSEGTEINNYLDGNLAAAASGNHDYTVTVAKTLKLSCVWASASGKMRIEVQIETGVATGVFDTKFVAFNSTANPNIEMYVVENISVAAGVRVRVIRKNADNQAQDVYTTISGHEI